MDINTLVGVTCRLLEGGGAAAFYVRSGKCVISGRDADVVEKIFKYVEPFTTPPAMLRGSQGGLFPTLEQLDLAFG